MSRDDVEEALFHTISGRLPTTCRNFKILIPKNKLDFSKKKKNKNINIFF